MQIYPDFAPQAFAVASKPAVAAGTPLGHPTCRNRELDAPLMHDVTLVPL